MGIERENTLHQPINLDRSARAPSRTFPGVYQRSDDHRLSRHDDSRGENDSTRNGRAETVIEGHSENILSIAHCGCQQVQRAHQHLR